MRWWLASLVLALFGCNNDFDRLYADDVGGPVDAGDDLPGLPALPDGEHIPDCEACAARECPDARAECLKDDDCVDELRCKGECSDPECLQSCNPEGSWSPWYTEYARCVFGRCRTACNTGNNSKCEDDYDWSAAETDAFDVRFRFETPPTFWLQPGPSFAPTGDTVRACPDVQDCVAFEPKPASKQVGVDGTVTLALSPNATPEGAFRGYLEVEELRQRVYLAPLARPQTYYATAFVPLSPPEWVDFERPWLKVLVTDCLGAAVAGARVTLPDLPDALRDDLRVLSVDIAGVIGLSGVVYPDGPTTSSGIAYLFNLPDWATESKLRVQAIVGDGDQPLAEQRMWVRPAFGNVITLRPRARSD